MNAKDLEKTVKDGNVSEEVKEEAAEAAETTEASEATETPEETPETPEGAEEVAEGDEAAEKKGFFKKKEKKDKRDEEIAELKDQILRQRAEFENYRNRTTKEKAAMFDMGARDMVDKILPILDNFERGFAVLSEEEKATPFAQGMEKVYKQMVDSLAAAGLKEMEALNAEFNPDMHNAVMHVEDENVGENIVVEVFQKGYMYKDSVVRFAMVKVAN
ncbi:MAG: nucleotide exchange factor GrpE [Lachnospiraceae bacterium]|nr:nucleotide exchange factor GrpE [Lachnospiraceae bacterium]